MKLKFLQYNQIDKHKWDETITSSYNSIVYAFSWYLDSVSPKWSALVSYDYQYVMPLPVQRKYGFKFVIQPYFVQQLGIFSSKKITPEVSDFFFNELSNRYRYTEINLNKFMDVSGLPYQLKKNITYELDLIQSYGSMKKSYNKNTQRNLKKIADLNIEFSDSNLTSNDFIAFYRKQIDAQLSLLNNKHYRIIRKIVNIHNFPQQTPLIISARIENRLCAVAFFIKSRERIIYLLGASSVEGKKSLAMFGIFDFVIWKFSGKNIVLDFEGSNISNIARVYTGFGGKPFTYFTLKINKLPKFLSSFKKIIC